MGTDATVGGTLDVTGATSVSSLATTGDTTTTQGIGAAGTEGTVTSERGIGGIHLTTVTFTYDLAVTAAALAGGAQVYTFPAHRICLIGLDIDGTLTSVGAGGAAADTPDVGVGVLVGSGANATLNAVGATAENIITGAAAAACAVAPGTAHDSNTAVGTANGMFLDASSSLYFNLADTWSGVDTVRYSGTAHILWAEMV